MSSLFTNKGNCNEKADTKWGIEGEMYKKLTTENKFANIFILMISFLTTFFNCVLCGKAVGKIIRCEEFFIMPEGMSIFTFFLMIWANLTILTAYNERVSSRMVGFLFLLKTNLFFAEHAVIFVVLIASIVLLT